MKTARAIAPVLLALLAALPGASSAPGEKTADCVLRGIVLDGSTQSPAHCTVTIIDARGATVVENESFKGGFRSDGRFEKVLPTGKTTVRISRGFETRAVERMMELAPNTTNMLQVTLERVVDLRQRGWFAGDSHAHMNHGEKTIPVDFDYVALTARAEDLQYLSLAQAWSLDDPTPEHLEAQLRLRSTPECVLTWNLEAPKNYYLGDAGRCLGHCWMMGVKGRTPDNQNVIDLLLQASAHDYENEKPTYANFESHRLIHAQGGFVAYTHPARWWTGPWGGRSGYPKRDQMRVSNMAVELPLDTLLGPTFDGIDVITGAGELSANAMAFELWALLLNHGYRLTPTGSSDACFDRIGGAVPGVPRTYAWLEGPFSLAKAARALAAGRTFVTTGPLLLVALDGHPPGEVLPVSDQARTLKVEAWPSGTDPKGLTRFELLRNGKIIHTENLAPGTATYATNVSLSERSNAWYCARVFGGDPQRNRAISGAFFFEAPDYEAPQPLTSLVTLSLRDATTGRKLAGTVTEVLYEATVPRLGRQHEVGENGSVCKVPGGVRLRADSPGYAPQTLSLFLDQPQLVKYITELSAEDLLDWKTFERIRSMLEEVSLTFNLQKN